MAEAKTPKKRGRPAMMPLASGAEMASVPMTFEAAEAKPAAPEPGAKALSTLSIPDPVVPLAVALPTIELPVHEPAEEPASSSTAEPAVTKPAPVEAVATPPSPEPAPVSIDATPEPAPESPDSKGPNAMATAFQKTAPLGAVASETADKAKAVFGDMNTRAKAAMEKSVKLGEEMTELAKGNVEAVIQSGRIAAKGAEALAQEAAETMKKNFESATATIKSFTSVKSPTELFQLQSDAAKSYFDSAVADMSKFTEQLIKLAGDVTQPLSSRYALAMEKVKASAL